MSVTMTPAEMFTTNIILKTMAEHHKPKQEAGVKVACLMASSDDGDGDGIKHPPVTNQGYPAAAKVRVNSYEKRVEGLADATIILDAEVWDDQRDDEKHALIDDMLEALELQCDDNGKVLLDLANRPRLKVKKFDYRVQGFKVVAERHGAASAEVRAAKSWADKFGQLFFGWAAPPSGPEAMADLTMKTAQPAKTTGAKPVPAPSDEYERMWRSQLISELSPALKPGKLKALAAMDPPILTLGDMADFSKEHGDWWGKDVKGFGEKGQAQLGAATDRYWADHQPPKKPEAKPVDVPALNDPKVLDISDLRDADHDFPAGSLAKLCRRGLLNLLTQDKCPEVEAVDLADGKFVVTTAPADFGIDVYALRPLYDLEPGQSLPVANGEDQYVGRSVDFGGDIKWIGPRSEMLLVRDAGEAAKEVESNAA